MGDFINKLLEQIQGKKTYIVAGILLAFGALQGLSIWTPPEWLWAILGALGLGALRAGVTTISGTIKENLPNDNNNPPTG